MKLNRRSRLLPSALLLLTAIAPLPALAHDDVISTTPESGEVVEAGIIDIQLSYSAQLMNIAESAEIIVIDPDGELANNGCATLAGEVLKTRVDLDKQGVHQVSWRVVSEDGHPIEGQFSFELVNESGHVSAGIVPGTECDWAIDQLPGAETPEASATPGWIYWLLWVSLPLAGLGLYLWLRPRPKAAG